MQSYFSGGSIRPHHETSTFRRAASSAHARMPWPGQLTREDLRHLVAEMID